MSNHSELMTLDVDGGLRAATSEADRAASRRSFLRKGAMAGGSVVAFATIFDTLASPASAALSGGGRSPEQDIDILNYALTLEFLEAQFYAQAVKNKAWANAEVELFARTTRQHEIDHVAALRSVLGKKAVPYPKFRFGKAVTDPATFLATAAVLEDTGVTAYSGQVTNIYEEAYLKAATSILTVEARHASWARFLLGGGKKGAKTSDLPAPNTFDEPATKEEVLAAVKKTKFIVG